MAVDTNDKIQRMTPEERVVNFTAKSNSIYDKFSPWGSDGSNSTVGSLQPYVWTKISDSNGERTLTKYDTQTLPIGSTVRDVKRVTKFMTSGKGQLFIGQQYLLQNQAAFNETRIYNPLSVLSATAAKGSTGLIQRPTRFLESNGSMGDMVASSLLSLVGIKSITSEGKAPQGAASGNAISNAANITPGAHKGLIRFQTGRASLDRFSTTWATSTNTKGGLLDSLATGLINKLKNKIANTIPFISAIGGTSSKWDIRPEYPKTGKGAYEAMLADQTGLLSNGMVVNPSVASTGFFNDLLGGIFGGVKNAIFGTPTTVRRASQTPGSLIISDIHRYKPGENKEDKSNWYTKTTTGVPVLETTLGSGLTNAPRPQKNIKVYQVEELQKSLSATVASFDVNPGRHSLERLETVKDYRGKEYGNYKKIPGKYPNAARKEEKFSGKLKDPLTLTARGFSDVERTDSPEDTYNTLEILEVKDKPKMDLDGQTDQSRDIIFFYFFDLVNERYIPFRATTSGISDLHSPDWEEISYLGRADKLYVYKGFTRTVNLSFTVYANSLKELTPMWKRINYLVGLSRPSKYTGPDMVPDAANTKLEDNPNAVIAMKENQVSSRFMYPPMVTFRLGDMFVDQPCVLTSIGVNIPDDALWETQRGNTYTYLQGTGVDLSKYSDGIYSRQLPTKVDISINMNIMEKKRSLVSDDHYFISQP